MEYLVYSTETVSYCTVVEAKNPEEAKELLSDGNFLDRKKDVYDWNYLEVGEVTE